MDEGSPERWLREVVAPALAQLFARPENEALARTGLTIELGLLEPGGAPDLDAWHLVAAAGGYTVHAGHASRPSLILELARADFADLERGTLDPTKAWIDGRLSVSGDAAWISRLGKVLGRTPRAG